MMRTLAAIAALLLPVVAQAQTPAAKAGEIFAVSRTQRTDFSGNRGSSGMSSISGAIQERVIAVRDDGLEIEYDLPSGSSAEDREREWQFPARIFKPAYGRSRLLNAPELAGRVDSWLKLAGMPREACGHWMFTWTAFKIECDPQSVLEIIDGYDLRITLVEGRPHFEAMALRAEPLKRDGR
ncbi:MAG TPA: hypothetical protein VK980_09710, partial [Sphingomonas sp.]|nr:hypothetical protein [Sphingomonas sp.]